MTNLKEIGKRAKAASVSLRTPGEELKNAALKHMAAMIVRDTKKILAANGKDVAKAQKSGLSKALLQRLVLTEKAVSEMASGILEVAALKDPVGEITGMRTRPNGMVVGKKRIPLGVVMVIYEARPNVTADCAALCIKSGNAAILKGGTEASESNWAIARVIREALAKAGLPEECVQLVPPIERDRMKELLALEEYIDLVIPRGGEGLIRFVASNSRIPVIKHYKGVCHVFVDEGADLDMARKIVFNSKVQKPGVCNAMETLLVHEKEASRFLPGAGAELKAAGVELRGCPKTRSILKGIKAAMEADWPAEYLDLVLAVKVVKNMDEAIMHIEKYGSNHTETIVTRDYQRAREFLDRVDSSVVLVNASTRFNDGNQLGLGAEIGISTTKIHAFGPMGLEELCTSKFIVFGNGQVRK